MTLAAGAATGPLLVLATERFVATALDVAGGDLPPAAIAAPVIALAALFAVQIVESVVRALCCREGRRRWSGGCSTSVTT